MQIKTTTRYYLILVKMYIMEYCVHARSLQSCQVLCDPLEAHQAPLSMGFSRQENWSDCHALLQGIFPTQGLKLHLLQRLHCRQILYH